MYLNDRRYFACVVKIISGNELVNRIHEEDIETLSKKVIEDNKHFIGKIVISNSTGQSGKIISLVPRYVSGYWGLLDVKARVQVLGEDGKPAIKTWILSSTVDLERYEKAIKDYLVHLEGQKDPLKAYYDAP